MAKVTTYKASDSTKYFMKKCKHPAIAIISNQKGLDGEPLQGILTGGEDEVQLKNADLFICLDSLRLPDSLIDSDGVLKGSTRQRVIYMPIVDMSIPDTHELDMVLSIMHEYLMEGKKVHVHCQGGHGRTGLVMACYFGKFTDVKEPIAYLRRNYCQDAVESLIQHNFIKNYTNINEPDEMPNKMYALHSQSAWQKLYDEEYNRAFNSERTTSIVIPMTAQNSDDTPTCDEVDEQKLFVDRSWDDDLFCPNCDDRVYPDVDDYYYCSTCSRMYTFHELI